VRRRGSTSTDAAAPRRARRRRNFADQPKLRRTLALLEEVGLGYLRLGQAATTLSGGEAQRLKIASELARARARDILYVLDEPTTGLHMDDVGRLLRVLHRLVDAGNTVVVIEHNLDVIRSADHVIDLGPEGGEGGGWIVAEGPPEAIAQAPQSFTGVCLREVFGGNFR
jgi:excinuclease ABC subunit A